MFYHVIGNQMILKEDMSNLIVNIGAKYSTLSISRRHSQGTHHASPVRASSGVSFVSERSELYFFFVIDEKYAISCYIGPRHIGSRLYCVPFISETETWKINIVSH